MTYQLSFLTNAYQLSYRELWFFELALWVVTILVLAVSLVWKYIISLEKCVNLKFRWMKSYHTKFKNKKPSKHIVNLLIIKTLM